MAELVTLTWFSENENLIPGLKEEFAGILPAQTTFKTIRLGTKYADQISPGDSIAISITNNPEVPNVIGYAKVLSVKKGLLGVLQKQGESLQANIGAKNWTQVLRDMQWVYGREEVDLSSIVSIIEFVPQKTA